jgi:hypothetical protein
MFFCSPGELAGEGLVEADAADAGVAVAADSSADVDDAESVGILDIDCVLPVDLADEGPRDVVNVAWRRSIAA